uniref:Uncharacterized protein n=1 Tax=Mycena chlorophos TaxID=658473 RepID=A0ABQ0LAV9_MYCCL|nr:predicted protein [Mycena chlorophos]
MKCCHVPLCFLLLTSILPTLRLASHEKAPLDSPIQCPMGEYASPSSLLALARANLSKLEAQIEDLVARGRYPAATSLIGSIQPLLSPIHKLPAEVLRRRI